MHEYIKYHKDQLDAKHRKCELTSRPTNPTWELYT